MHPSAPLKAYAHELGFAACGIATACEDTAARFVFHERIDLGFFDGLNWFTHDRADRATEPGRSLPRAGSVITLAAPYRTSYEPDEEPAGLRGRVARYAWGRDYHRVLEKRLKLLAGFIEREYGGRSRGLVDYGPLAERAYAARAGIGWFGKSTNLLLPGLGSWVVLSELLTTMELEPDPPLAKSCGGCTRCIDACPTRAISGPYVLDSRRCISFQTIENRGSIPRELRPLMGDWVFGCDLCQDACPVGAGRGPASLPEFAPASLNAALPELTALLELDDASFLERFKGRAVMRAKRAGLARNACVALGNLGDAAAVPALTRALQQDPAAVVRGHAAWALARIGGAQAVAELERASENECDPAVLDEIRFALSGSVPPSDGSGMLADRRSWLAGMWQRSAVNFEHEGSARASGVKDERGNESR